MTAIEVGVIERVERETRALTPTAALLRQALRCVGLVPIGDRPPGDWLGEVSWPWPTFAPRARPFDHSIDET